MTHGREATGAAAAPRTTDTHIVPFRGGGFAPAPRLIYSWLTFAGIIALWQFVSSVGAVDPLFLPSPLRIAEALRQLAVTGELWRHLSASLTRIALGWTIGTVLGLSLGIAIGLFSLARAVGIPMVAALYPVPKIALLPLLILWLGIGEASKVATIAAGVFFPTVIATFGGVDAVPRNLIRMAQSFNVPTGRIVRQVILPAALPSILSGFRISVSTSLLLLVAAEMIGAQYGLGAFLLMAGNLMQTDQLMAGVVILSILGLLVGIVLSLLERSLLAWR